jgi:hypothetical protein
MTKWEPVFGPGKPRHPDTEPEIESPKTRALGIQKRLDLIIAETTLSLVLLKHALNIALGSIGSRPSSRIEKAHNQISNGLQRLKKEYNEIIVDSNVLMGD